MAGIRRGNTSPEIKVRRFLHRHGFRFRLHGKMLPGTPDLVLPRYRLCIFVHGCFWHRHPGCRSAAAPKTRADFWQHKFDQNVSRDARVKIELLALGWRVFELWECGIRGPEPEMGWLLEAIRDSNQKTLSWPSFQVEGVVQQAIKSSAD
ncbi:very short patch repair endonuclease [Pseudomonas sp. LLC-1]|uniref:very short patch repair endonuclease n=1 Tax=Pseudomonas sp. LLC-1 TaxID=1812180 RepID=UPI003532089F